MMQAFASVPRARRTGAGVDRIVMLLAREPNLREVVSLPVESEGRGPDARRSHHGRQARLRELHIRVALPPRMKE